MALPTTEQVNYGITLNWQADNSDTFGGAVSVSVSIQRTTGSVAAATSAWTTVYTSKVQTSPPWSDILPSDGKRRWYRIRQGAPGYEPSTWLGTIDAKPVEIVES